VGCKVRSEEGKIKPEIVDPKALNREPTFRKNVKNNTLQNSMDLLYTGSIWAKRVFV
jgi:hypothetical protein